MFYFAKNLCCKPDRLYNLSSQKNGFQYDPRRISCLREAENPINEAQLERFVSAKHWMYNAKTKIFITAETTSVFHVKGFERAGKCTKQSTAYIKFFNVSCSNKEQTTFDWSKSSLEHQVTLAYRDVHKHLCVYKDACDSVGSGVVSQLSVKDLLRDSSDQRHQTQASLSGHCTGSQMRWSTIEKEAFVVMTTIDCMHWLVVTPEGFET